MANTSEDSLNAHYSNPTVDIYIYRCNNHVEWKIKRARRIRIDLFIKQTVAAQSCRRCGENDADRGKITTRIQIR